MAKQLKLRRGTTSQHSSFTGAEGEVTVDTTKDTVVVHDGSTAGGHPLVKENAEVTSTGIADNVVDEANLKVSNSPTNGQFLSAQSGNTGGLTWATVNGTTINNNGDNYVITGSGTANTLNAEAGLRWNGTKLDIGDNKKFACGNSDDLQIWHDGNDTFIRDDGGNGDLKIEAVGNKGIHIRAGDQSSGSHDFIKCQSNAGVELYYDNTKKAETTSAGVTITGTATATTFSGSGASLTNLPAANLTGTLPSINGGNLTVLTASSLTGSMPAIPAGNLTDLNASALGSGIVPTARLGSGTANSDKVLKGNNTWGDLSHTAMHMGAVSYTHLTLPTILLV